jgi:hypothetical protein
LKRLNPNTGKKFKYGDTDHTGMVFHSYILRAKNPKNTKYYYEHWVTPEKIEEYKKQALDIYATIEGRANNLLRSAKTRAKKDNAEVSIDDSFIIDALKKGTCELTGIPFDLLRINNNHKNPYGPSLDRKDSKNRNYTKENTRVVLSLVNSTLNEFTEEQALPILKAMVKAIEEKHARQDTATPVPEGAHSEGQDDTTHWAVHGAGPREDSDSANDHRGEPQGEDAHRCTEEGGGVGVGSGVAEVESFEGYDTLVMYGFTDDEIRCVIQAVGDHDSQPREPSVAP